MLELTTSSATEFEEKFASRVLNLGCGRKRVEGAINVDLSTETRPDVVHDLNVRPWPLPSNHFTEVIANDVVEHLDDVLGTLEEVFRVCRDRAVIRITVPHFSSANAHSDPTHRHLFGYFTLDCLLEEDERSFYTRARFRYLHRHLIFRPTLVNKIVWRLANQYPMRYEHRWAWMFPAWFITIELEVRKAERRDQ